MTMLDSKYKFYLSFENSFCEDYVTEKFFTVLAYNTVPVVMGGANYSKMAPDKSYIDSRDFKSVKDLAEYLKYLNKNTTAYVEYLEWKSHFHMVKDNSQAFCDLCEALNRKGEPINSYEDISKWWRTDARCIQRGRYFWSRTALEQYIAIFKTWVKYFVSLLSQGNSILCH